MKTLATLLSIMIIGANFISLKTTPPPTTVDYAEQCNMTEAEFVLMSSVVEAESNRCQDSTEGRRYIALCIFCRQMDTRFPNTITEVLCAPGQFSTVRNGRSVTQRTELSDLAVYEAYQWIHSDEEYPWVLYFNCRGYNGGTAYACIGGNYFMTMEPSLSTKMGE